MTPGPIDLKIVRDRLQLVERSLADLRSLPQVDLEEFTSDRRNVLAADAALRRLLEALFDVAQASVEAQLAKAEVEAGDDVVRGVGAIVAVHKARQLLSEIEPRLEGDVLVADYGFGESTMEPTAAMGMMAAVGIPAFIRYIRRSKSEEATKNVGLVFQRALEMAEAKRRVGRSRSPRRPPPSLRPHPDRQSQRRACRRRQRVWRTTPANAPREKACAACPVPCSPFRAIAGCSASPEIPTPP